MDPSKPSSSAYADFMRSNEPVNYNSNNSHSNSHGNSNTNSNSTNSNSNNSSSGKSKNSLPHADFMRNNDPNNNSSTSSRSRTTASYADFMRNNDPNNNNNNSSSNSSSNRSNKPITPSAIAIAAAPAVASYSSGSNSTSEPSYSHNPNRDRYHRSQQHYHQKHHYDDAYQRAQHSYLQLPPKDPPPYDSRPNLKNDLSDSYRSYTETTDKATHERQLATKQQQHQYHSTSGSTQQQPSTSESRFRSFQPGTAVPSFHNYQKYPGSSSNSNNNHNSRSDNDSSRSRPSPSAGRPPASTTLPACPGLPIRKLGRRGLLLGRPKHDNSSNSHNSNSNPNVSSVVHDPGPLQGLSTTITVECKGCGELIEKVPKNSIALDCRRCQKFFPTVTCRVMQYQ